MSETAILLCEAKRERGELVPVLFVAYRHKGKVSEFRDTLVLRTTGDAREAKRYSSLHAAYRAMVNLAACRNPNIGMEYAVARATFSDESHYYDKIKTLSGAFTYEASIPLNRNGIGS